MSTGRRITAGTVAALAVAATLAACSGGTDRSSSGSAGSNGVRVPAPSRAGGDAAGKGGAGTTAPAAEGSAKTGSATKVSALARAALQGDVIYTADVSVAAPDVAAAVRTAREIVDAAGGYVLDSTTSSGTGAGADVTFKVPPAQFQDVLDQLQAKVSKVTTVQQRADDVTGQIVDVQSRLSVQRTSVGRVQDLLKQATSLPDIVQLESDLTRRQADLESLEAQLASLKDRVQLATVSVHVTQASKAAATRHRDDGFLGGLRSGWHAFATAGTAALVVLGAVLPFAVVALLALLIWRGARRARPGRA